MVEAARRMHTEHPEWRFQAPGSLSQAGHPDAGDPGEGKLKEDYITISTGDSHALMQQAACGVIASGTATLEAAWFGLPYCLIYRIAWPTYFIGKMLVKVDYIGLVNILAGKGVVEEFIQGDADPCHIQQALEKFMTDAKFAAEIQAELAATAAKLGEPGCHQRAANAIVKTING